ncbi:MAG: RDD family protein [Candidatus Acidiferrum sp.]
MTKTCLQCGAVLPSSMRVCNFCDSSVSLDLSPEASNSQPVAKEKSGPRIGRNYAEVAPNLGADPGWRGELAQRLQSYRARRRRVAPNLAQSELPFEELSPDSPGYASVAVEEAAPAADEDFSFTIAIGRNAATREESQMVIDVSLPPDTNQSSGQASPTAADSDQTGLYPVASIDERRLSGLIDIGCLLFAYGGFLTLFGSLGGQFTFSKLSAAVCVITFVFVYLQYFALFTIFGGTTPGMMLRGLQVVSFSGEPPSPRQMLWRSAGYMLSAGTFFMGFLSVLWDEDALTWHDRLSHTYLCPTPTFADMDATHAAHSR